MLRHVPSWLLPSCPGFHVGTFAPLRASANGCGGHRNGSLAKDLPATRERKIIGLMSLSLLVGLGQRTLLVTHIDRDSS